MSLFGPSTRLSVVFVAFLAVAVGCGPGDDDNGDTGPAQDTGVADTGDDGGADTRPPEVGPDGGGGDVDGGETGGEFVFRGIDGVTPETTSAVFPGEVTLGLDYSGTIPEDAQMSLEVDGQPVPLREGLTFAPPHRAGGSGKPAEGPGRVDITVTIGETTRTLEDGLGYYVPTVSITAGRSAPADLPGVERVEQAWTVDFNDDDEKDLLVLQSPKPTAKNGQWSAHLLENMGSKMATKKVVKFKPGAELANKVKMAGPGDGRNPQTGKEIKIPAKKVVTGTGPNPGTATEIAVATFEGGELSGPTTLHSFKSKTEVVDYVVGTWTDPDNGQSSDALYALTKKPSPAGTQLALVQKIEGRRARTLETAGDRHELTQVVQQGGGVQLVANEANSPNGAAVYLTWLSKDADTGAHVFNYVGAKDFNSTRSNHRNISAPGDGNDVVNPASMQARILEVTGDEDEDLLIAVDTNKGTVMSLARGSETRQDGQKVFDFDGDNVPIIKGSASANMLADVHVVGSVNRRAIVLAAASKNHHSTRSNHRNIIRVGGGLGGSKATVRQLASLTGGNGDALPVGAYTVEGTDGIRVFRDGRMRAVEAPTTNSPFSKGLSANGRAVLEGSLAATSSHIYVTSTVGGAPKAASFADLDKKDVDTLIDWGGNEAYLLHCKCEGGVCKRGFDNHRCATGGGDVWNRVKLNASSQHGIGGDVVVEPLESGKLGVTVELADDGETSVAHATFKVDGPPGTDSVNSDGKTTTKNLKKGNRVALVGFGDISVSRSDGSVLHGKLMDADGSIRDQGTLQKTGLLEKATSELTSPELRGLQPLTLQAAPSKDDGGRHTPFHDKYRPVANYEGENGGQRAYVWLAPESDDKDGRILALSSIDGIKAARVAAVYPSFEPEDNERGRLLVAASDQTSLGEDTPLANKVVRLTSSAGIEEISMTAEDVSLASDPGDGYPCAGTPENCPPTAFGDINGDGLLDLAVANTDGEGRAWKDIPSFSSDGAVFGRSNELPPNLRFGLRDLHGDITTGALLVYGDGLGFARRK